MINKKGALDFKTYMYIFIFFSLLSVTFFGMFTDMSNYYGTEDMSTSQVLKTSNESNALVRQTHENMFTNNDPSKTGISAMLESAWDVTVSIINSVTYPFKVLVGINTDIETMSGDKYKGFTIPMYIISGIISLITITLVILFIQAIFGRKLTE